MKDLEDKVKEVVNLVVGFLGKDLISLYLTGSALYGTMKKKSDIDVFGIVVSNFDFSREDDVNKFLVDNFEKKFGTEARFRGITISELEGGEQKGRVTKYIPISILIKTLRINKFIYGKNFDFNKWSVKPMSIKEEGWHYIGLMQYHIPLYKKGDEAGFKFKDFIKLVFWLANVELQLEGYEYTSNFVEIDKRLKKVKNHVVHLVTAVREKGKITEDDKKMLLDEIDKYVNKMKGVL